MNEINITGIKVSACHGVLESEKLSPQPFIFDVGISCDISAAALSDRVEDTVNYASVASLVSDYCKNNSFNLIERLSYGAARLIAERFKIAKRVQVTVHKPHAPIPVPFADVSVTASVERVNAILSLGSSCGDREQILNGAIQRLKDTDGLEVQKVSSFIHTPPYGGVAKNEFVNCALSADCLLSPHRLLEELHKIEGEFGRTREKRWEDRTLDIDIVFFGNKVICEDGLCIPHPDYFNRPFMTDPIKEISPDFVCPLLHKRISDL